MNVLEDINLLEQKTLVEDFLSRTSPKLSAHSFVQIFAWQDYFYFEIEVIHDNVCIFAQDEVGTFMYLPPVGSNVTAEVIEQCFHKMEKANTHRGVARIENVSQDLLPLFPSSVYHCYKKSHDYCYYREDLTALKGNAYKSKRSSYNYFIKNYDYRFLPYTCRYRTQCDLLYAEWMEGRKKINDDTVFVQMLEENRSIHQRVLQHYEALGLIGRVVIINDEVKGYTFGYPLNKDMFCVLFETVDVNVKGLPVYLFREFCADTELQPYSFINVMDDFEMNNIKKAKLSFNPTVLLPSYTVSRKKDQ